MIIKYCIRCEKEVMIIGNIPMHDVGQVSYDDKSWQTDWCDGPFVEMAPPEMTEEMWDIALERDYTVYEEESIWEPEI